MLEFFETSTGNAVLSNGLGRWDAAIDGARRGSEDDDQGYAGRSLAELVEAATRAGGGGPGRLRAGPAGGARPRRGHGQRSSCGGGGQATRSSPPR